MSLLNKTDIRRLLPHDGAMCLLDAVEAWSPAAIRCVSLSHQDKMNPLRRDGRLEGVCGLEYAAQAMAVHIGLTVPNADSIPKVGYIGAVRDCVLHVAFLDRLPGILEINANQVYRQNSCVIYDFSLWMEKRLLLQGRASLFVKQ